jgi:hypothetical protein
MKRLGAGLVVSLVALALAGAAFASTRHASLSKVTVTFSDSKLGVSAQTLDAGTTTFVVHNNGRKLHVLAISGPGLKAVRTPKLAAGHSATLTVTLRAGSYMLSDPVGLGVYKVQYLSILPAANVTATGTSAVVSPEQTSPAMCGYAYTP